MKDNKKRKSQFVLGKSSTPLRFAEDKGGIFDDDSSSTSGRNYFS